MLSPQRLNLTADRWVAFIRTLPIVNADLTGAEFKMQVRPTKDVSGTPLADLSTVTASSAEGVRLIDVTTSTVSAHRAAGRLAQDEPEGINPLTGAAYSSVDSVTVSRVGIRINETTMEAMPFPAERGDDAVFWWDLHVTPGGLVKDLFSQGTFTVKAGATQ